MGPLEVDVNGGQMNDDADEVCSLSQKSGKWSAEEKLLADRLIASFEAGTLSDCEVGCTLRSYLARKLKCAPMRISKKFAGSRIGKLAYTGEVIRRSNEINDRGSPLIKKRKKKVESSLNNPSSPSSGSTTSCEDMSEQGFWDSCGSGDDDEAAEAGAADNNKKPRSASLDLIFGPDKKISALLPLSNSQIFNVSLNFPDDFDMDANEAFGMGLGFDVTEAVSTDQDWLDALFHFYSETTATSTSNTGLAAADEILSTEHTGNA